MKTRVEEWVVNERQIADDMQCYCSQLTHQMLLFYKIINLDFKKYDLPDQKDKINYCKIWYLVNFLSELFNVLQSAIAVILNAIISRAFMVVTEFMKLRYKTEEQLFSFYQITFIECFNMGIIVLLTSFDHAHVIKTITGTAEAKDYDGFEPSWYGSNG